MFVGRLPIPDIWTAAIWIVWLGVVWLYALPKGAREFAFGAGRGLVIFSLRAFAWLSHS